MFCWQCGGSFNRRPDGSPIFLEVEVDAVPRSVHLACSDVVRRDEAERTMTRPADEVPYLIQHYPEVRYG